MAELRVHALIDSLNWGGAESLLADLAAGAPAAGIALSVGYLQDFNGSPNVARLRAAGIEPELVGVRRLLDAESLRRVRRHLARVRPDVVHTHLMAADVQGTIAARSLGLPAVSTVHLVARRRSGDARQDVKDRLTAFVRRHGSARTITVSDAARAAYVEVYGDARRRPRVTTIHNGLALEPPAAGAGPRARAALGLAPDALVIAIVSVLRPGKGHDVVAEVVRRLAPRFPALRLLVVGSGPSAGELGALFAPLGERALLLGHRTDVPELLAATDVLLHPTRMDAFPGVLLEASAIGVPIVATAVGGIPEIVADGDSGLLLDAPASADAATAAVERLLADPALRARMGAAARARFEAEFTARRWAQRLRALYDEVLAERAAGARR
jgi:glycosyltransferase involved in cell wall biosynthesis